MTTRERAIERGAPPSSPAPFATRPVLGLAALTAVVLGICGRWYGYFGDELYFIVAGRHPSWGYADQPPVLPLLAAGLDHLAPGSTVVLRLPAVLTTAAAVVVAALIARELGGRSRAQLTAAGATAGCFWLLAGARLLATSTLDPFWWAVLLLLIVRWVRTDRDGHADDRLLLLAGLVLAVALNTKFLVLALVAGVAVGVLVIGPRRLLTRPLLWVGIAVAGLATVPTLLWQVTHGWPQWQMGGVVAGEADILGNRWEFLPLAVVFAGVIPGVVLLLVGLGALLRRPELARWRFLGVTVLVTTAALVIAGGRPYYVAGFYVLLFAAGAVALQEQPARRWWRWTTGPVCLGLSGLVMAVLALPIGPSADRDQTDFTTMGQVGWPELAVGVSRTARIAPTAVVITNQYWTASALAFHRIDAGLPPVFSPHRGFGYLAAPPAQQPAVLVGRFDRAVSFCSSVTPLPPYVAAHPTPLISTVPLALCVPRAPWAQLWSGMQSMT